MVQVIKSKKAYIVEESIVDPQSGMMTMKTTNLSHRRLLSIAEVCEITQSPTTGSCTETIQSVQCNNKMLWGVAGRIEAFGASKFAENLARSRQALLYVLERLPAPPTRRLWLNNTILFICTMYIEWA